MNITDYQFMQSLNMTRLTPYQFEQLAHRLLHYTIANYDSARQHIQQIDENYPYSMPTWLIILITILLGMNFSDKYKACRNSKDRSKVATTSVQNCMGMHHWFNNCIIVVMVITKVKYSSNLFSFIVTALCCLCKMGKSES